MTPFPSETLERVLNLHELILSTTDKEQLLVLSLEQAQSDWQIERHGPELDIAWVEAVERIGHHGHEKIHVEN